MDPETSSPACPCCSPPSTTWRRSVKRKLDQEEGGSAFADMARAEMAAIREALERQQQSIQKLCVELDEERNASSTAANEAMSMILRLQREKAEVQMEFSQFKRFAEEKMDDDQRELAARDYLLYKRDQALQYLYSELHAYQHRLLSYPEIPDAAAPVFNDLRASDYAKPRCKVSLDIDPESDDDKYTFEDEEFQNLECMGFRLFGRATSTRRHQGRRGKGKRMEGRRKR